MSKPLHSITTLMSAHLMAVEEAALCPSRSCNCKSQLLALTDVWWRNANEFGNSQQHQHHSYRAAKRMFLKVRGSQETERCNQQGHSTRLPWLLPDTGLIASEPEGSRSKNTSSHIHKMNSLWDAICLSIAWVPRAQVRSNYSNRNVSSLITQFCFTSS